MQIVKAGRDIELCNSFELDYNVIDGVVVIDRDYYNTKEEQFKQVRLTTIMLRMPRLGNVRYLLPETNLGRGRN